VEYERYVDSLLDREEEPDCTMCTANRKVLEQAWQVVANEFFDPYGRFSQTKWAGELKDALESAGGELRIRYRSMYIMYYYAYIL
jgi:hypothetical protein